MKFTIPRGLDLERLILSSPTIELKKRATVGGKRVFKTVPVKSRSLLKHIPYCYYLIGLIVRRTLTQRDNVNGYVNLRSVLLDKVIPNNTRILVTNLLTTLDVIEVNTNFRIGDYSKSYRITDKYPLTDLITINLDKKGQNLLESLSYYTNSNNDRGEYPYVSSFFKRVDRVQNGIKKVADEKTDDLTSKHIEYFFQQEQVLHNINLDYDAIIEDGVMNELSPLVDKINSGGVDLSINVNNRVNRVFSPITNLKKEHRKYLRCRDGNSLMSIDFKTSHVFHLLKIIVDSGANGALLDEVEEVKSLALADIYQYVANQYQTVYGKTMTRNQAKDLFITHFLYGKYPDRKMSIWVKSLFPNISKFVAGLGRRKLSIELQRREARLLNNLIFKRIALECDPTITVFGVFDCVFVDENRFDQVYNIMIEESTRFFGYEVPQTTSDFAKLLKV